MNPELIYAGVGGDKYGAVMAARFLIPTLSAVVVVVLTGLYLCTVSVPGAVIVGLTLYMVIRIRGRLDAAVREYLLAAYQKTNQRRAMLNEALELYRLDPSKTVYRTLMLNTYENAKDWAGFETTADCTKNRPE